MNILILGGRGYVGSKIAKSLSHKVFTLDRHPGKNNHIQADISKLNQVKSAFKGIDVVINCVGLSPIKNYSYEQYYQVHTKAVRNIIKACEAQNVKKLIHISALGASNKSTTKYLKTKYLAEKSIQQSSISYTILRPSVIFSKKNELIKTMNMFSKLHVMPNTPAKMQPIHIHDLVTIVKAISEEKSNKQILNIAGPKIYTLYELTKKVTKTSILPIPWMIIKPFAHITSKIQNSDLYTFMQIDNTTTKNDALKYLTPRKVTQ